MYCVWYWLYTLSRVPPFIFCVWYWLYTLSRVPPSLYILYSVGEGGEGDKFSGLCTVEFSVRVTNKVIIQEILCHCSQKKSCMVAEMRYIML